MAVADHHELTEQPAGQLATAQRASAQLTTSHTGYELVVSPFLLALFGWWVDSKLGWTPVLTIALAVFGVVGAVTSMYLSYRRSMDEAAAAAGAIRGESAARRAQARQSVVEARAAERARLDVELAEAQAAERRGVNGTAPEAAVSTAAAGYGA